MTVLATSKDNAIEPSFGNALPHFLPIAVFPLIFAAAAYGGWWLLGPLLFFTAASLLESSFGKEDRNMDPKTTSEADLIAYNLPVWLWAVLWPTVLIYTLWQIFVTGQHAWWEGVLLAAILTIEGQAIFIVGHELIHRRNAWERYIGEFLLASGSYPHYATEHFYIHHAYAGTPMDVGSAPKGLGFWHYFPRELRKNLTEAWAMAQKRMARRNLSAWHYSNPFWRYGIETAAWYAFIYAIGGWLFLPVYMILCLGTVFSMKVSNYIQHYGLRRIRLPNGRFEKVLPRHAWSANDKFDKWMFFNFQRHADHHVVAGRSYPLLQHYSGDASPQMPGNHAAMFHLALRPKRWFETMDPLVDQWRAQFYPQIKDWSAYDSRIAQLRPKAFDVIAEIFEGAPRFARAIERNPELLDTLQSREFTDLEIPGGFGPDSQAEAVARSGLVRVYWTHEFDVQQMKEQLSEAPVQDAADSAEIVRNWVNDKTFQVGMHIVRGNLTPIEAGTSLSNIAEAAVATVFAAAVEDIEDRYYQVKDVAVAAIALGDLASREAAARLSLELAVVHEGAQNEFVANLLRRFEEAVAILTRDNLLFKPMRPGNRNFTHCALSEWRDQIKSKGGTANLSNVIRTRCIFVTGDHGIQSKFEALQSNLLADGDIKEVLISQFKEHITSADADAMTLFQTAEWGLKRVETYAQILRLKHFSNLTSSDDPVVHGAESIIGKAGIQGVIDSASSDESANAARLWRSLAGIQRMLLDDKTDSKDLSDSHRLILALACGASNYDALLEAVREAAAVTRNLEFPA